MLSPCKASSLIQPVMTRESQIFPSFPRPSTSNPHRPQVSHSTPAICDCEAFLDARECCHCRRGCHAASDRARLVLQRLPLAHCGGSQSVKALWVTRALRPPQKRARMASLRPVGAIRMRLHSGADALLLLRVGLEVTLENV